MFELSVHAVTHKGVAKPLNEDTVSVFGWTDSSPDGCIVNFRASTEVPRLVLVADGLGGHAAGDRASREVVGLLNRSEMALADSESVDAVITAASRRLSSVAQAEPMTQGMGTTIAGINVFQNVCMAFNVGDSPIFLRQHNGYFTRISGDDSPRGPRGQRTQVVTQAIGSGPTPTPHVDIFELDHGDVIILCSDGLTDFVDRKQLDEVFEAATSGEQFVRELLRRSLEAQCADIKENWNDNVSVVVVAATRRTPTTRHQRPADSVTQGRTSRWRRSWLARTLSRTSHDE